MKEELKPILYRFNCLLITLLVMTGFATLSVNHPGPLGDQIAESLLRLQS
jgi:hypothetical protein